MEKLFSTWMWLMATAFVLSFESLGQTNLVDIPDANFLTALKNQTQLTGCFVGNKLDADCNGIKNLIYLDVSNKNISSIEGVQYLSNLTSLRFWNNQVTTVSALPAGLTSLTCSANKITSLPTLPLGLLYLECSDNRLTALPTLPSDLNLLLCGYNQLTTLPALPEALSYLSCKNNEITELPQLPASIIVITCANNQLTTLPVLPENLDSLLCDNNNLVTLPSLPARLGRLDCYNNNLAYLPDLPDRLYSLSCYNNKIRCLPFLPASLHYLQTDVNICLPNIPNPDLQFLNSSYIPLTKRVCNNRNSELSCVRYPSASGRVYIDADHSGTYTEGDFAYSKVLVKADPYTVSTDLDGSYRLFFENLNSDYTIIPKLPAGFIAAPANYSVRFNQYGETQVNKDFILTATAVDLSISFVGSGRTAPGFETSYTILARNNGSSPQNADITFEFDNHLLFNSCLPAATNVGNTLSWHIDNLKPFEERTFIVYCTLPASVNLGTVLTSNASINLISNDEIPANNKEELVQIVRGSYDPNDKQVDQGIAVTPTQIATQEDFNYVVRFQNTGTDTAYTVVIRDTLSTMFDISTLETVSASHHYTFSMKENAASWTFDNIKLPDSTVDKKGSNGFVKYKVKPKNTLQLNDKLENTAHIYFDFNEAVITNTTVTKVAETTTALEDKKLKNNFSIYPNPSKDVFNITFAGTETASIEVLSADGRVITSLNNITKHATINLSGQSTGVYFLRVTSADLSDVRKLILE